MRRYCARTFAMELISIRHRINLWLTNGTHIGTILSNFASEKNISVTDADAGPALRKPTKLEIQHFIMKLFKYLTGRNALAIDFLVYKIAHAQMQDFNERILHATEIT
ncbi:MAG: hypothetical protein EZS28_002418 [Streblomastix strix]|uniref:Uncharacterized protein n=1 Tax=Streblomastix strix TaxID=222440 RepID=A0A5J4X502_9EUKA|nr:MAG: hypothetical protein EZS28_002418 [Streblomastix strix]